LTQESILWPLLKRNIPPESWRCAVNADNIVASVHVMIESSTQKFVFKNILTSAFSLSIIENEVESNEIPSDSSNAIDPGK
jgi:hypothetical protein